MTSAPLDANTSPCFHERTAAEPLNDQHHHPSTRERRRARIGTQVAPYSCTDSIALITVNRCAAIGSPGISMTSSSTATGTLTYANLRWTCFIAVSGATDSCIYTAPTATGTYTNSTGNLVFTGVSVTSDGHGCPSPASFSVTYNPVVVNGSKAYIDNIP